MSIQVPEEYVPLVQDASKATGMPYSVVAAQWNDESGFNANAVSPAGAEGAMQFLPSTYDSVAQQAGVQPGTEFNPQDEEKAYVVYMNELLSQEGGNIYDALEAYNAGPGNLSAGSGYASAIMGAANEPTSVTTSGSTNTTTTTGFNANPLDLFGIPSEVQDATAASIETAFGDIEGAMWQQFMSIFGISGIKDLLIRMGLLVIGFTLLIIGVIKLFDLHPVQTATKVAKSKVPLPL